VVAVSRKLLDLATTPALRATPPVPGGELKFQTRPLPQIGLPHMGHDCLNLAHQRDENNIANKNTHNANPAPIVNQPTSSFVIPRATPPKKMEAPTN